MKRVGGIKKLCQDAGTLATGHAGAGLMSIFALAVTSRTLGLKAFGLLVMIQTFVRVVDELVNFQTWQALIKYATQAREAGDSKRYVHVVRSCAWLDRVTAGAALLLIVLVVLIAWRSGWISGLTLAGTLLYGLTIPVNLVGAPTGVLRMAGRYRLMASLSAGAMAFKSVVVLAGWWVGGSFTFFLVAWAATDALQSLFMVVAGELEWRRQGAGSLFTRRRGRIRDAGEGFIHFAVMTNLTASVKLVGQRFVVLMTGGVLDEAMAGLLRVGQTVARVIGLVAEPIDQVVYPELSQLWAKESYAAFYRTIVLMGLLGFGLALAAVCGFVLWGKPLIALCFGEAYAPAYGVTIWLMVAAAILMIGLGLRGGLLAQGRAGTLLWIHIVCYGVCVPLLPWLLWTYGVVGAGIYTVAFQVLRFIAIVICSKWRPVSGVRG